MELNKREQAEEKDEIFDMVELFAIGQRILGLDINIKRRDLYDGIKQIKVEKGNIKDFLVIKYSDLMRTVKFNCQRGVDDKLINRLIQLDNEDKISGEDRFLVEDNENGSVEVTVYIMGKLENFKEIFPKMYSHL